MKTRRLGIGLSIVALLGTGGVVASCQANVEEERTTGVDAVLSPGPLPGAIFTTTVDGEYVNGNVVYEIKEDVYLDGGPGPNAPPGAAGLPPGDYYFQVTDPSGQDLLSSDHISCRKFRVGAEGFIEHVYPGMNWVWQSGSWVQVPCQHLTGVDQDYGSEGAITVQLFPYDDTPNPGGVYKVWATPVDRYEGDPNLAPPTNGNGKGSFDPRGADYGPGYFHGFIPAHSKTDNYKVDRNGRPCDAPTLIVKKFHDANLNGAMDGLDAWVAGWAIDVTDPLGPPPATYYTEVNLTALPLGTWTVEEDQPTGTVQTVGILDGVVQSSYPTADPVIDVEFVSECDDEIHEIVYGDAGLGSITVCKVFDRNANGERDEGEPYVPGWSFELNGTDVLGNTVGPLTQVTDSSGCTTFADLLPGSYTVSETVPSNWQATGPTSVSQDIESSLSGSVISGTAAQLTFTNVCTELADFDTKGYWHNKNGLAEITDDDIAYVNGLDPYDDPTPYFGAGDEPFDGYYSDGFTKVATAYNFYDPSDPNAVAPEGTPRAEISHFLVDPIAGYDCEQLAQQLLAFIFNVRHRLGDPNALIDIGGELVTASSLIADAIAAWQAGTDCTTHSSLLDGLNNNDAVPYVPSTPCAVD